MPLRKEIIRLAYNNPGPLRQALLGILQDTRTAASLPRATRRPPGKKFREGLAEWATRDAQTKLEAGGVPQDIINSALQSLTGSYGPFLGTVWSGGYTAQNYKSFATQQEAVDWLAGKTELADAPGGALGFKRYPDILKAFIDKYGAGNEAVRDKVRAQWNKLKKHQKLIAAAVVKSVNLRYPKGEVKDLAENLDKISGETAQRMLPVLEWAAKVPMWPDFHW